MALNILFTPFTLQYFVIIITTDQKVIYPKHVLESVTLIAILRVRKKLSFVLRSKNYKG